MEKARAVLRDTFGFAGFRHAQEEVRRQVAVYPIFDAVR